LCVFSRSGTSGIEHTAREHRKGNVQNVPRQRSEAQSAAQLVHKIQQAVIDDAAMDFVGFNTIQVGMGKNVKGYLITPNDYYQVTKDLEK
jgi:peptide/nickel transport system substrate-binding protein